MKVGKIIFNYQTRKDGVNNAAIGEDGTNSATIDVDGIKIWGSFIGTIILPLVLLLYVTLPKSNSEIKLSEQKHKFELLQFALNNKTDSAQMRSIKLLLATGLLKDESGKLEKLINIEYKLPNSNKLNKSQ